GVVVATDADPAGDKAAERAYWQLTARGDDPRRLVMADGVDPADVLRRGGPAVLRDALDQAGSLAEQLIDRRTAAAAGDTGSAENHVAAVRAAAEVIGALPPNRWLPLVERVTRDLDAVPGSVHLEVFDAGHAWTLDPTAQARARLRPGTPQTRPAGTPEDRAPAGMQPTPQVPDPDAALVQRWAQLARDIDPRLPAGQDWPRLAVALTRAHAAGYHVAEGLPRLAAQAALPEHRPGAEMYWRLLDDWHAAAPPHVQRQAAEPGVRPRTCPPPARAAARVSPRPRQVRARPLTAAGRQRLQHAGLPPGRPQRRGASAAERMCSPGRLGTPVADALRDTLTCVRVGRS
ncbi:MAG: hypothetical protein ACR2FF_07095, partial [Mycobacteriales bacterium]